jgi:hypothetical protein
MIGKDTTPNTMPAMGVAGRDFLEQGTLDIGGEMEVTANFAAWILD